MCQAFVASEAIDIASEAIVRFETTVSAGIYSPCPQATLHYMQ
jgi:hypothetical protein